MSDKYDQYIEGIVVQELKDYYTVLDCVCSDWYIRQEDEEGDKRCLEAIKTVLSHYLTNEEHEQWLTTTTQGKIQK